MFIVLEWRNAIVATINVSKYLSDRITGTVRDRSWTRRRKITMCWERPHVRQKWHKATSELFFSFSRMDGGIDTAYSAIWLLPQKQFVSYHFDLWYISIADAKMKPNRPL